MVRTSVTHSAIASCATFLFLPHFDVICDLLLNRRTATRNLFVKYIYIYFQGVRSRSRDISTSLSRTSSTKFMRLEGFKMVHAKYC